VRARQFGELSQFQQFGQFRGIHMRAAKGRIGARSIAAESDINSS